MKQAPFQTGLDLRLVDRHSSIPLASAVANIVWGPDKISTEHADVHGLISAHLPEGAYDILIAASGYLSSLLRGVGVLEGQRVEIVRALIAGKGPGTQEPPSSAIGGMCFDRLEHPIANIIVQATSPEANYTVRSDRHGCYVLNNVVPGEYEVIWRNGDRALFKEKIDVTKTHELLRRDVRLLYL